MAACLLQFLQGTSCAEPQESPIRAELRSLSHAPLVPNWQEQVGATTPNNTRQFTVKAKGDGQTLCTKEIQQTIDDCAAAGGGTVELEPGQYVTGSLFLKSNVHFHVAKGVTLLGAQDDDSWPIIHTRVAGIETDWCAAMINVRGQQNVAITGEGILDARGKRFWKKFRKAASEYTKNLRWAVDYDVMRPHFVQIYESRDVTLRGLTLNNSPFWTVHVVFSKNVTVDGLTIRDNLEGKGPSTDGVNIDSSAFCLVENCDVDNNDDNFTLKAGMNADGLRVGLPAQYILFRNNIARQGHGVFTIGSDMSGGIQHCEAVGMRGIGTLEGVRFKSAKVRGGVVQDILIHDIKLENVRTAISINLNWFPEFSYPVIPPDYPNIPPVWHILTTKIPPEKGIPHFRDITIMDVRATGAKTGISVTAYPDAPIENISLKRVHIEADKAGTIQNAKNWSIESVSIKGADGKPVEIKDSENVTLPET